MTETTITEAVIGLGSTIFSVKYAVVIRMPPIDHNHFSVNHENENLSLIMRFSQLLSSTNEMTVDTDLGEKTTKVFLLLRKAGQPGAITHQSDFFKLMPSFQLPSKCKTTCLELLLENKGDQSEGNCCKFMKICSDVSNMSLDYDNGEMEEVHNAQYNWFISSVPIVGLKRVT